MLRYYPEVLAFFGDCCTEVFRGDCQKAVEELLVPGSSLGLKTYFPFPSLPGSCCYFFQPAELCLIQVITFFSSCSYEVSSFRGNVFIHYLVIVPVVGDCSCGYRSVGLRSKQSSMARNYDVGGRNCP